MATTIGYNDGITAMMNRLREMDPAGTIVKKVDGKWPKEPLEQIEPIPLDQWKAYDKAERAFSILVYDHDAGGAPDPPEPPEPPPVQTYVRVAPRVAYQQGGSDARFCTVNQPGVTQTGGGHTVDESGATYDENGLCKNGVRSGAPAVTGALEINSRAYCDLPTMGSPFDNTGSWAI